MATVTLTTFSDIYTAILEELKIQSADGTTTARIKRDINMIYLKEIVPYHNWWWLRSKVDIALMGKVITGTVAITKGTNTVTFTVVPKNPLTAANISLTGFQFRVTGYDEIYEILAHTSGTTSATLGVTYSNGTQATNYGGTTVTAASYTAWQETALLPTDCQETTQVRNDFITEPMLGVGLKKFRETRQKNPYLEGRPLIYCSEEFDLTATTARRLRWWPSINTDQTILHVDYQKRVATLSADGDTPLIPPEDMIVLFYGAVSRAWIRERNEESAQRAWSQFTAKLQQMAGRTADGVDNVNIGIDQTYMYNKRYSRFIRARRQGAWWRKD